MEVPGFEVYACGIAGGRESGGGGDCTTDAGLAGWVTVDNGTEPQENELLVRGYRRSWWRTALTWLLIALTLGLARLVFHWVPHWLLRATCAPCSMPDSQYVLIAVSKDHCRITI